MKRPCPSWQLTRLSVPLPPRRPLQATSRAIPVQVLPEQEGVEHQSKLHALVSLNLNTPTNPNL